MKKRIIISLVMMILLLAVTCLPVAAEPPATKKLPCAYCNRNRTFEFVGYSANKTTHYPAYKCTTCKRVGSTMSGSGAHTGGRLPAPKRRCVLCAIMNMVITFTTWSTTKERQPPAPRVGGKPMIPASELGAIIRRIG